MKKKLLVVGSGGREHALVWKLGQSPRVERIFVAPGNGGTREIAENVPIEATQIYKLAKFAEDNRIDLTVVGPDDPLAMGIVNLFKFRGLRIFGPTSGAARVESSKVFAKELMIEAGIPTAAYQAFTKFDKALEYIRKNSAPLVVKASGLALGKGVYICKTTGEAEEALKKIMIKKAHKDAGNEVVIEECLEGQEISLHAFCDGKNFVLLPTSQDHKLAYDGDKGPNTGGMGSVAPLTWVVPSMLKEIGDKVVRPILDALARKGTQFSGLLYPGLIMTKDGPKVLEFNARFGDPETQCYMRLLKTDLLDILEACVEERLSQLKIEWNPGFAVCVVLASGGYPNEYQKGFPINGVSEAEKTYTTVIFHAGTKFDGKLYTSGGRVLSVTAAGETLPHSLHLAYRAASMIRFEGMHYRSDIGQKVFA